MSELPARPGAKIIRHEKAAVWRDGYAFLKAASEESARIVADARIVFDEAQAKGTEAARLKVVGELADRRRRVEQELEAALSGLEVEIVDLVLSIARQVIGTYPDGDVAALMAKKAMAEFRHEKLQAIRVSSESWPAVQAIVDQTGDDAVTVEADISFGPGDLVLSGTQTVMDAGMETQLAAIRQSMARGGEPA
jgi:type III secretion protein L